MTSDWSCDDSTLEPVSVTEPGPWVRVSWVVRLNHKGYSYICEFRSAAAPTVRSETRGQFSFCLDMLHLFWEVGHILTERTGQRSLCSEEFARTDEHFRAPDRDWVFLFCYRDFSNELNTNLPAFPALLYMLIWCVF
uniref:Uncharacterized protein n=1 Tax=Myotis myotis TaxID=51298 RepID=A0A7J7WVR3_MYOMY|nr:hypothetical protein mMyoMyo1_011875 [Myotis myotis]